MHQKQPAIYIVASKRNGTLYTGVTSDLARRIFEHKNHLNSGFTKKYHCELLVYYEVFEDMRNAIEREKQIKAGSREKKIRLIESVNPDWRDLYQSVLG
ncbi:MAG: GIY-YIG nuclease family protein [Proteobacteria bacterium]|nr:GIY-YIG nuclease family protein [Pseudomonadota bacterium]